MPTPSPTVFNQSPASTFLELPSPLHRTPSSASTDTAYNASPVSGRSDVLGESQVSIAHYHDHIVKSHLNCI
jgi:hypothetical protein